jgi:hypothetical protein
MSMDPDSKQAVPEVTGPPSPTEAQVYRTEDSFSATESEAKKPWWHSIKEPGSAAQIISAALVAIAIGMAVAATVDDVPDAAADIINIPGNLWLRALKCVGKLSPLFSGSVLCDGASVRRDKQDCG